MCIKQFQKCKYKTRTIKLSHLMGPTIMLVSLMVQFHILSKRCAQPSPAQPSPAQKHAVVQNKTMENFKVKNQFRANFEWRVIVKANSKALKFAISNHNTTTCQSINQKHMTMIDKNSSNNNSNNNNSKLFAVLNSMSSGWDQSWSID